MLESTFHAVHSSFHAVLGVAEHFTKMKMQVSQIFSAIAAVRMIKYIYKKFLYLFGLASNNPKFGEAVWNSAAKEVGSGLVSDLISDQDIKQSVRWPILMYLGLVFAAPYIIWRLLRPLVDQLDAEDRGQNGDNKDWARKVIFYSIH